MSAVNEFMREMLAAYLETQFAARPDLLPHVIPTYPPGAKRLLRDNGVWAGALTRDNVTLVTEAIQEITPTGIVTVDGVEHPVDVIVYGTGFQASQFLTPMRVRGRNGVDLHEQWAGDARAYLGHHRPRVPQLLLSLRAQHEHRDQRQHHLFLRVRSAVHSRLPRAVARASIAA